MLSACSCSGALDVELCKYVGEAYPKRTYSVYCTKGKYLEGPGADFEFTIVISASRVGPQNTWIYQKEFHYLMCFAYEGVLCPFE